MRIAILTDLEGVSGIVDWDRHEAHTPLDAWQRTLMTGEVNAAIAGAFDAGATHVNVTEGHEAVEILKLDERATLASTTGPTLPLLAGWEDGYDALFQIGAHSMAGTPDGCLSHTLTRQTEYIELNGRRVGEIGIVSASAGELGIPCVLVSGDQAACREAGELLEDVETAQVKTGYGAHYAQSLAPAAAHALIRERAAEALDRIETFKPFVIPGPIAFTEKLTQRRDDLELEEFSLRTDVTIVDDRTVTFHGDTVLEACARYWGLTDPPVPGGK